MWTRPRPERSDIAKFVGICLDSSFILFFLLFSDTGCRFSRSHYRCAHSTSSYTYMHNLHAACAMYVCCVCSSSSSWARRPRRFPTHPLNNPRTAAGPETFLFLSVSTCFETTLAGPRQTGDDQPWEERRRVWAGLSGRFSQTPPPFISLIALLAVTPNRLLHQIFQLFPQQFTGK